MKISLTKEYTTVSGLPVTLYALIDAVLNGDRGGYGIIGAIHHATDDAEAMQWNADGAAVDGDDDKNLVEANRFAGFGIDDLVWAIRANGKRVKRYFAGVSCNGNPLCWAKGTTSHTQFKKNPKNRWANVELIRKAAGNASVAQATASIDADDYGCDCDDDCGYDE